jgi:hypothetical protein
MLLKHISVHCALALGLGAATSVSHANERGIQVLELRDPPALGKTLAGQTVGAGGFSGLVCLGRTSDRLQFLTHTDRGPNTEPVGNSRPFLLPAFVPTLLWLEADLSKKTLQEKDRKTLLRTDQQPISGLPNRVSEAIDSDEQPIDIFGKPLALDPEGIDPEGIARLPDGSLWMVEEYGPSILKVSSTGQVEQRFVPQGSSQMGRKGTEALPSAYRWRKLNRGFEALASDGDKLYAFLQSPLRHAPRSRVVRILEFDARSGKSLRQFPYILEGKDAEKIGDAISIGQGRFLVIEQETKPGAFHRVYEIDLSEATDLGTLDSVSSDGSPTFETQWQAWVKAKKLKLPKKRLVVDLVKAGLDFASKAEGICVIDEWTIAIANDNDFGIGGNLDPKTGWIQKPPTERWGISLVRLKTPLKLSKQ